MIEFDGERKELRRAYRENLKLVLEEVARLQDELVGKTVITADHGELLGERSQPIPIREYGHPGGTYLEQLVKAPWITLEFDERKSIESGEVAAKEPNMDTDEVENQLRALGYRT